MKVKIKICGITSLEDALLAVEFGVDALGFVFAPSKRRVSPLKAREIIKQLPPFVTTVGVFMNERVERIIEIADYAGLEAVQLHGQEDPIYCEKIPRKVIKRINPLEADFEKNLEKFKKVSAFLFDPGAGEGRTFNWEILRNLNCVKIIAGGLNNNNVRKAIFLSKPYGVDVSTGVEKRPGKKDPIKLKKFIEEVRKAEEKIK